MELLKETIRPTVLLCAIGVIVGLFVDYRYSLSLIVGMLVSFWHLIRLDRKIKIGLKNQHGKGRWAMLFFTNMVLLAIPFMLAVMFPMYLNLVGVAMGLLLNKVVIYGSMVRKKGGMRIE